MWMVGFDGGSVSWLDAEGVRGLREIARLETHIASQSARDGKDVSSVA